MNPDLKILKAQLKELEIQRDDFELNPSEYEEQFDDMLDSCYPELFGMLPSYILSKLDPIMYSCELSNYVDGLEVSDDEDYQELLEQIEDLEAEIEELEEGE